MDNYLPTVWDEGMAESLSTAQQLDLVIAGVRGYIYILSGNGKCLSCYDQSLKRAMLENEDSAWIFLNAHGKHPIKEALDNQMDRIFF